MVSKKFYALVGAIVLILILGGAGSYYGYHAWQTYQLRKHPADAAQAQLKSLADAVGKHVALPSDEQPTLITVTDVNKVKNEPFFANAENNDIVLAYQNHNLAVLYRPAIDKVIAMAPIAMQLAPANGTEGATTSATLTIPQPVRVAVLNGTATAGLAKSVSKSLESFSKNISISKVGDAKNKYPTTGIVDLTGNNAQTAQNLANLLHATVIALPANEAAPTADVLVLIGDDFKQ